MSRLNTSLLKKGFTLVEVLVVIAIMLILFKVVSTVFSTLKNTNVLDKQADTVASVFEEARSLTLASYNATQYGVHVESGRVVRFTGSSYVSGASSNVASTVSSAVSLSKSLTGGGSEVVFNRLTGTTSQYGTITVSLVASTTQTRSITISSSGIIEKQ